MNTCESYAALLDAFAEGDLFTEDMLQVQKHLNDCPACQAYLDDLFTMRAAFPTIEDTEVPAGFADSVMAAVAAHPRTAVPAEPVSRKKKSPWAKVVLPLAACCAIVVLLQGGPFGAKKESAFDVSYSSAVSHEAEKAKEADYALDNYIARVYGSGVNEKVLRELSERDSIARLYLQWYQKQAQSNITKETVAKKIIDEIATIR